MAVFPIGSHFAPPHQSTKRNAVAASPSISASIRSPQNLTFSRISGITNSRLSRHSVLVRAEDKIRGSSSTSIEEQSQPIDVSEELEDLMEGSCDPICSIDEPSSSYFKANYQPKTDVFKAIAVLAAALTATAAINHSWVAANQVLLALDEFIVFFPVSEDACGKCHGTGYGIVVWDRIRRDHLRRDF